MVLFTAIHLYHIDHVISTLSLLDLSVQGWQAFRNTLFLSIKVSLCHVKIKYMHTYDLQFLQTKLHYYSIIANRSKQHMAYKEA